MALHHWVMRVQSHRLELGYMQRAAAELGVNDLLNNALAEAGLSAS